MYILQLDVCQTFCIRGLVSEQKDKVVHSRTEISTENKYQYKFDVIFNIQLILLLFAAVIYIKT